MPSEGASEASPQSLSYMSRLKSCGARRDWPEVLVVLEELRKSEEFADTYHYTAAMTVGKRAGEWRAVLALLDELDAERVDAFPQRRAHLPRHGGRQHLGGVRCQIRSAE